MTLIYIFIFYSKLNNSMLPQKWWKQPKTFINTLIQIFQFLYIFVICQSLKKQDINNIDTNYFFSCMK